MAVLAIEADPRQASAIRYIVCDLVKTKLTLVDSIGAAIEALATHTPDLILLPPLLSPGDEAELLRAVRSLPAAAHVEMQVTPMLESPAEAKALSRQRRLAHAAPDGADDVQVFAEHVSGSLVRARKRRRDGADERETNNRAADSQTEYLIAIASEKEKSRDRPERRQHVRIAGPFDGYRRGVLDTPLLIQDLSESGCFVNSVHSSEYDGELTLAILLPHQHWITVKAEIVRSSPGFGFGVRFLDLSDAVRAELARVVTEHAPASHPS
jgi:CheY-like chemotaxis protein